MSRTPEQVAADDKLTEAIQGALHAYGMTGPDEVMVEYGLVVAKRVFEDDGDVNDAYAVMLRDNSVALHSAIGLFRYGVRTYESEVGE